MLLDVRVLESGLREDGNRKSTCCTTSIAEQLCSAILSLLYDSSVLPYLKYNRFIEFYLFFFATILLVVLPDK